MVTSLSKKTLGLGITVNVVTKYLDFLFVLSSNWYATLLGRKAWLELDETRKLFRFHKKLLLIVPGFDRWYCVLGTYCFHILHSKDGSWRSISCKNEWACIYETISPCFEHCVCSCLHLMILNVLLCQAGKVQKVLLVYNPYNASYEKILILRVWCMIGQAGCQFPCLLSKQACGCLRFILLLTSYHGMQRKIGAT